MPFLVQCSGDKPTSGTDAGRERVYGNRFSGQEGLHSLAAELVTRASRNYDKNEGEKGGGGDTTAGVRWLIGVSEWRIGGGGRTYI